MFGSVQNQPEVNEDEGIDSMVLVGYAATIYMRLIPKRRSAYCLDSPHGAWNFSHAKHSKYMTDVKQSFRIIRRVKAEFLVLILINPSAN